MIDGSSGRFLPKLTGGPATDALERSLKCTKRRRTIGYNPTNERVAKLDPFSLDTLFEELPSASAATHQDEVFPTISLNFPDIEDEDCPLALPKSSCPPLLGIKRPRGGHASGLVRSKSIKTDLCSLQSSSSNVYVLITQLPSKVKVLPTKQSTLMFDDALPHQPLALPFSVHPLNIQNNNNMQANNPTKISASGLVTFLLGPCAPSVHGR